MTLQSRPKTMGSLLWLYMCKKSSRKYRTILVPYSTRFVHPSIYFCGFDLDTCTISQLVRSARSHLDHCSPSPAVDSLALVSHALGKSRTELFTHGDALVTQQEQKEIARLLAARRRGEPIAYLTGVREFWSLPLRITEATLIPRPETELLVEHCLAHIPPTGAFRILDLGTGSGAIALALARERPRAEITATDFSAEALRVAAHNAHALNIGNVHFLQGEWYTPVKENAYDLVVSNPPYVADDDPHLRSGDCRFEPSMALSGGESGLQHLEWIIANAPRHLTSSGRLSVEHGFDQQAAVRELFAAAGFTALEGHFDLEQKARVFSGKSDLK